MKNVGMNQKQASNRLSSGFRINSAADDAAGLAISENMRAQIRGLDQASRNAQDGQAMLLTTEGGLEEIGNQLQRVRELMVQAANDTNTQNQRGLIEQEIGQLGREILSMQNRVEFNTNRVLAMGPNSTAQSGRLNNVITAAGKMDIDAQNLATWGGQLSDKKADITASLNLLRELNPGQAWSDTTGEALAAFTKAATAVTAATAVSGGNIGSLSFSSGLGAVTAGATVSATITALETALADVNRNINDLNTDATNGGGKVRADFTTQQATLRTYFNAATTGDNVAFYQVGANASQGINYDFENVAKAVSVAGWTVRTLASAMSAPSEGSGIGNGVRVSPYISALDKSISDISTVRANLGAVQNRMDYTMRSLDISSENLSDSESRVRNADIAKEMMRFTMTNVLQNAAISMLSQANQLPQNLLQLLR